jgi:hypothetical protein
MKRRTILRWSISVAATWPFWKISLGAREGGQRAQPQSSPRLPDASVPALRELAVVVLPTTLTRAQTDAVVEGFRKWLDGYKSGAVISHGYGIPRARVTPTIVGERYAQQLAAIEQAAASASSKPAAIASALADVKIERLPATPDGRHIVSDFMSFYFGSSEANDLAYGAKIGRESCRGLSGSSREPARIAATGA